MASCLDKILCDNSSKCNAAITDENGNEIETRYLHDGDTIYLYAPERTGYTFNGFTYQPNDGSSPYPITPKDEGDGRYSTTAICGGTYITNYSANFYTLTVIPDSEDHGTTNGSGRYQFDTGVMISVAEKPHYHFAGWYIDDVLISTDVSYFYTVKEDTEILAKFEVDEYSIVGKPENRLLGTVSGSGVYEYGTSVTLTATSLEGSYFVEWVGSNGDTNPNKTITVTQNEIFIARFAKYRYEVTTRIVNLSSNRGNEIAGVMTGQGMYEYGSVVRVCASPNEGFKLVSLDDGAVVDTNNSCITFTITQNTEVVGTFKDAEYTLTLYSSPVDGGYITDGVMPGVYHGGTYVYNTVVTAQANNYTDYTFVQWSDLEGNPIHNFVMTRDITATAFFSKEREKVSLIVRYDMSKGVVHIWKGSVEVTEYRNGYVSASNITPGTRLTVTVDGINGYKFIGWDDLVNDPRTPRNIVMTDNITREVFFSDVAYREICLCDEFTPNNNLRIKEEGEPDSAYVYFTNERRCFEYEDGTVVIINYASSEHFKEWDKSGLGIMRCEEYRDRNGYPCLKVTLTDDGVFCVKEKAKYEICFDGEFLDCVSSELYVKEVGTTEKNYFRNKNCYEYEEGTDILICNPMAITCFDDWDVTGLGDIQPIISQDANNSYLELTLTHDASFSIKCKPTLKICGCAEFWDVYPRESIVINPCPYPGGGDYDLRIDNKCYDYGCIEPFTITVKVHPDLTSNIDTWRVTDKDGQDVGYQFGPTNASITFRLEGEVTVCPILLNPPSI